ncbi:MAG TPA: Hpt domain-containing protein, partial [Kofleriaceae bacterium]|nr:Hpt domain-containing protein [Kofleriaceae bacterium]
MSGEGGERTGRRPARIPTAHGTDDEDARVSAYADDSFNTSEYRALRLLFRDECHEALEEATHHLLRAGPDHIAAEALTELLRTTHSLKGTAGTVGLRAFADAAHRLEGVLERLRAGALPWSATTRDWLVEVVDWLRALADASEDEAEAAALAGQLDRRLAALAAGRAAAEPPDRGEPPARAAAPAERPATLSESGAQRTGRAG